MDAALQAALAGKAPTSTVGVKIALLGGETIRLSLHGGTFKIGSDTYVGRHDVFGSLDSVEPVGDGADGQATRCTITLLPPTPDALADIADPLVQDSPVEAWLVAIDPETGLIIGDPELLFRGELDYGDLSVGASWSLSLECGTEEGRLLEPNENWKLSHAFHQSVWAGEMGLEHVTDMRRKIYWRVDAPSGAGIVSGGSGGGSNSGSKNPVRGRIFG